jgi:hypothetical protein
VLKHVVLHCPECDEKHDVIISVRAASVTGEKQRLLFGGPASSTTVVCPETKRRFVISPRLGEGDVVIDARVAGAETGGHDDGQVAGAPASPAEVDVVAQEFDAWTRSSRERALTFCSQMLTASSGSVAVYFAVLAFVGSKDVSSTGLGWFAVVPPVLFLAAVVCFALALAPRLAPVSQGEFARFRADRLMHLARWLRVGLGLFVSGVALALVVFALAMPR